MAMDRVPGTGDAKAAARSAARKGSEGIELLARLGYAAKGAVYLLVGGLAAAAVFGGGGTTTGSSGALGTLADDAWGRLALGLIALGLFGYVVWRLVSATLNPENDSTGKRVFYGITGLLYGALAVEAARLALSGGGGGGSGDGGATHWSAELMGEPFGQILVAAAGLAVGLYGLQQLVHAWRADLDDRLDLRAMSAKTRKWTIRFGRAGLAARGMVLAIVGGYFVTAALQSDPSEARGIGGVLSTMRDTPWLLALVSLGLIAYGVYQLVRARYRRITPV